jgi:rhodanese-related sulfurtransferase
MDVMQRAAINDLLETARAELDRVKPSELAGEVREGAVVVDIRPFEQRLRGGPLPGAIVVDRNVLEWRLDPSSPHRLPEAIGVGVRFILVCDEGYSSSLAAATLHGLGLTRATDLVGGFQAWNAWQAAILARREAMPVTQRRNRFWHHDATPEGGAPGEAM